MKLLRHTKSIKFYFFRRQQLVLLQQKTQNDPIETTDWRCCVPSLLSSLYPVPISGIFVLFNHEFSMIKKFLKPILISSPAPSHTFHSGPSQLFYSTPERPVRKWINLPLSRLARAAHKSQPTHSCLCLPCHHRPPPHSGTYSLVNVHSVSDHQIIDTKIHPFKIESIYWPLLILLSPTPSNTLDPIVHLKLLLPESPPWFYSLWLLTAN